jgi:hypothetical protein
MPVMFMLLQKLTFDGKFQICQISFLPTDAVILDHTVVPANVSVRTLKAKEDKNLDSQAKTNFLFVVSESDIEVTHHT